MPVLRLFVCGLVVLMLAVAGSVQAAAAAQQDGRGPAASEPGEPVPEPAGAEAVESEVESAIAEQEADIAELERRIEVLAEEIERLRSGEPEIEVTVDQARALGLAPSAAATYGIERGVSIAGYGEMLLENWSDTNQAGNPAGKRTQFDYLRAILYVGYRFSDKFIFNSEIEVEHAKEIFVEFAYVDWLAHENFGVRAGMLLVPMGLVNEFHEPNVFIGAERPVTEQSIIPSTWRENGGGVYGSAGDFLAFRAYVVNGFNGSKFSSSGLRGGRQKGYKAKAENMAFTGRVDITPTPGVFFGGSFYVGGSGQGDINVDGRNYGVRTSIFDVHGQAQFRGLDLRGLYAQANLDDTAELNHVLGLIGSSGVGEKLQGGYVQIGYDLLSQVPAAGGVGLTPYIRLEKVDTQAAVLAGFSRSASKNNRYTTFGVELKPIPEVVVKVDHMWVSNDADTGINQFNISVGYAF